MVYEDFNVLESVVNITAERDIKSLEKVLLDTLDCLKDFNSIILLRLIHDTKPGSLNVIKSLPDNAFLTTLDLIKHDAGEAVVRQDDTFKRCITDNKTTIIELEDTTRVVFPISVNKKIFALLDIHDRHYDAETERLIKLFIQIYSNFLAILHDNEHDTLTGLLNRKTFDSRIAEILSSQPDDKPLLIIDEERRQLSAKLSHWIGILDIDFFKKINDNFGHIYGDEVLILFADLMKKVFRSSDLLFRFGGEEFIVVLLNSTETDAVKVFERFRKELEETCFPQVGQVTVSTGVTLIDASSHISDLLDRADKSLYYAKDNGRNQVCNYSDLLQRGLLAETTVEGDIELF